jgi:uncharacterized protein (TIGR02246 family)
MKAFCTALMMIFSVTPLYAGPKEDAFAVVEQFKKAFDASDPPAVERLFARDAIFMGTSMQGPTKDSSTILKYFQNALMVDMPRRVEIESYDTLQLSDTAFLFTGQNRFFRTKDGKTLDAAARFTFVITKGSDGWRISHFHSSRRPMPQ